MEVIRERERYVVVTVAVQTPVQVAVKQLLVCWTLDTHTVSTQSLIPCHSQSSNTVFIS